MKKIMLAASFVFLMSVISIAQTAAPVTDPDWRFFAPKGEEFATEVPVAMSQGSAGRASRRYSGKINGTYFFVFSEPLKGVAIINSAIAFLKDAQPAPAVESHGSISAEAYAFGDDEGFSHRALAFKSGTRAYLIHAVSEDPNDPLIARFFQKLTIGTMNTIEPVGVPTDAGQTPKRIALAPEGGLMPVKAPTTPLRILTKARPAYTDIARVYAVQGSIPVRVTFLPDGTIGDVMAIRKLPFGLTKSAIATAKTIQFEPATENGAPVQVKKVVEYSFSIF